MPYTLRPYQKEAVEKVLWSQKLKGNDLIVLPTGSGKSLVIAEIVNQIQQPVLIFQPTREILKQNKEKLLHYVDKEDVGVFSASMNQKTIKKFTLATIGSVYKHTEMFQDFKLVLFDEAHLYNPKNGGGMYNQFLEGIGSPKVVGLTATPFRMDMMYEFNGYGFYDTIYVTKMINRMKGWFWKRIVYCLNIPTLLEDGYLCPMRYYDLSKVKHYQIPVNKSQSEFDLGAYEKLVQPQESDFAKVISGMAERRNGVLVFCTSVEQADRLHERLQNSSKQKSVVVTAKTKPKDRRAAIEGFRDGSIQVVLNVSVLTVGFDHPALDCIVMIRPTRSLALYSQMLGRGIRPAPGKKSCLVIDFSGNVKSMGRIETLEIVKNEERWDIQTEKGYWHCKELYRFNNTG